MSTRIIDFWKNNFAYWICNTPQKRQKADEIIRETFWGYNWALENVIGQIIHLDQFSRHFCRLGLMTEECVQERRRCAAALFKCYIQFSSLHMDEIEIIFALMPFKHLKQYDFIFEYLHHTWMPATGKKIINCHQQLQKFYMDTYKKAFTLETVRANLIVHGFCGHCASCGSCGSCGHCDDANHKSYDAKSICEYYPENWLLPSSTAAARENGSENDGASGNNSVRENDNDNASEKLAKLLDSCGDGDDGDTNVFVSLSGGVDSMVMLTLLKRQCQRRQRRVVAVHLIYGNRPESIQEYYFLTHFCSKIDVPLVAYRIKWVRRGDVDRQFYEQITRELRFSLYKAVDDLLSSSPSSPSRRLPVVLLGHIKDDVIENIWTNIAHCHHLDNLKKMDRKEVQHGVQIVRPFLEVDKHYIYSVSKQFHIPYLKNTTPSWSNRGKFREHFHKSAVAQFGECVDVKMLEFAHFMQSQHNIIAALLYTPIYASFANNRINITPAVNARIDANSWAVIFGHVCHTYLNEPKPSIKCVKYFTSRLYCCWARNCDGDGDGDGDTRKLNVELSKSLKIQVTRNKHEYFMNFHVATTATTTALLE